MNKILLALTLLGAGAGAFLSARQSTTQLQHEANDTRDAWLAQTQLVAVAQSDEAALAERVRELKQTLAQPQAMGVSAIWFALQTNRAGRLTPELRERLLEELGFNWRSSPDFIVVSKEAVREIGMPFIDGGKVTDIAATVLAITPEERGQVEAAMQRVQTDYKEWALAHVERTEPKDDVVAQYTLLGDPAMSENISNNFAAGVFNALGKDRADLTRPSARDWLSGMGIFSKPTTMIVKRYSAGNEQRPKSQLSISFFGDGSRSGPTDLSECRFPEDFRPIFPNGWADVAKREGFELPEEPQEK